MLIDILSLNSGLESKTEVEKNTRHLRGTYRGVVEGEFLHHGELAQLEGGGHDRNLWGISRNLWGTFRNLWGILRNLCGTSRNLWGISRNLWGVSRNSWGTYRVVVEGELLHHGELAQLEGERHDQVPVQQQLPQRAAKRGQICQLEEGSKGVKYVNKRIFGRVKQIVKRIQQVSYFSPLDPINTFFSVTRPASQPCRQSVLKRQEFGDVSLATRKSAEKPSHAILISLERQKQPCEISLETHLIRPGLHPMCSYPTRGCVWLGG